MVSKQDLKAAFQGTSPAPLHRMLMVEVNGAPTEVMIKGPSIAALERVQDETGIDLLAPGTKLTGTFAWLAMLCTCHPTTGERLFDDSDMAWIKALPAGEWPSRVGLDAFALFLEQQKKGWRRPTGSLPLEAASQPAPLEVRVVKQATQTSVQAAGAGTSETAPAGNTSTT